MTEREIRYAVCRGQGKAVLFFRSVDASAYRELILDLCSNLQAFDPMFEDRSEYLWRIVETLPNLGDFVYDLAQELRRRPPLRVGNSRRKRRRLRDRAQILEILTHAFRAGYADGAPIALLSIREFELANEICDSPRVGGQEGLDLAVELADKLENWQFEGVYEDSVKTLGKRTTERRLRKLAKSNPNATRFRLEDPEERPQPKPREKLSPDQIVERVLSPSNAGIWDFSTLDDTHWKQLAAAALSTESRRVCLNIYKAYQRQERPFDGDVSQLLERANVEATRGFRNQLHGLLDYTKSDEIRKRGLEMLESDDLNEIVYGMDMLERHARIGDLPLWGRALRLTSRNDDYFHWATISTRTLKFKVPTEMLRYLFERGRCELCRVEIAERLWRRRQLTMVELEELCADSYEFTQKSARRWLAQARRKQEAQASSQSD